jgi:hypothetical protein
MPNDTLALQELTWPEIREQVTAVNPEFAKIIDSINPDKKYTVFVADYLFGDEILQRGEFYLPTKNGELVAFSSEFVSKNIKEKLSYNFGSNPAALVLDNSLELFLSLDDRVIPYSIISKGNIFGLWKILDRGTSYCPETFLWGLTAGARSLFMLPKISEASAHNRLKTTFNISEEKPQHLLEHWKTFKQIANNPIFKNPWKTRVLFFSKSWFEHLDDPSWQPFNYFLLNSAWQNSHYWRNQYIWDLVFSIIQKQRNLKPSPYTADTVKHLLALGTGAVPGFQPAQDDSLGPITQIQQAYAEIYRIGRYEPIIMQPAFWEGGNHDQPIYYSLQHPTSLEFSPKASRRATTISDLYDVYLLLKKYIEEILTHDFKIQTIPLYDVAKNTEFRFYHNKKSSYKDIKESEEIQKTDPVFMAAKDKFPKNSMFFNGCIQLVKK